MSPNTMRLIRRYHFYAGIFFAPAIFFFALSGALQTFRLQEEKGYGGTPPGWIVWMASVHKDSRLPRPAPAHVEDHHHDGDEEKPAAAAAPAPAPAKKPQASLTLPMKIFAALMSVGLMLSALLGVLIALNTRATRRTAIAMLAAGMVLPLVLLLL